MMKHLKFLLQLFEAWTPTVIQGGSTSSSPKAGALASTDNVEGFLSLAKKKFPSEYRRRYTFRQISTDAVLAWEPNAEYHSDVYLFYRGRWLTFNGMGWVDNQDNDIDVPEDILQKVVPIVNGDE